MLLEHLYHKPLLDAEELYKTMLEYRDMVEPYVCDVSAYLYERSRTGKNILLEGQLGSLKDPDHGIYPMVTSSSTLAAYGAIGAGIPPYEIKTITDGGQGLLQCSRRRRVCQRDFRRRSRRVKKARRRRRRVRRDDGPSAEEWAGSMRWPPSYGCRIQGATEVALTVLDVLGYLDELPICVGYEIDGKVTKDFPTTSYLEKAKPVYKKLPGWKCDIRGIRSYEELPENCRKYIEAIERKSACRSPWFPTARDAMRLL